MSWDEEDGEYFYPAPPGVGYWRLAIYGAIAAMLWFFRDPYLTAVRGEMLQGNSVRGEWASLFVSMLQFLLNLYAWLPPVVQLAGLTVILGGIVEVAVQALLLLLAVRPFLFVGSFGVSGLTGWGRQEVPWRNVHGIRLMTSRDAGVTTRQLEISTGAGVNRATFITPAKEAEQLPAIIKAINFYAPRHLHVADDAPSWPPAGYRR